MKNNLKYISIFLLLITLVSCDENEVMPSFTTKGTATHTMAGISASNAAPQPSENISLLLSYVSPSSDPLKEITVRAKVGAAAFVDLETLTVGGAKDELLTETVLYTAPATSATTVIIEMVITSQKEYPQVLRTTIKTK